MRDRGGARVIPTLGRARCVYLQPAALFESDWTISASEGCKKSNKRSILSSDLPYIDKADAFVCRAESRELLGPPFVLREAPPQPLSIPFLSPRDIGQPPVPYNTKMSATNYQPTSLSALLQGTLFFKMNPRLQGEIAEV